MCKLIRSNSNNAMVPNPRNSCKQWRDNNSRSRVIQFEWKAWLNAISITLMLTVRWALRGPESPLLFCYLRLGNSPVTHRQWKSSNCFSQLQMSGALTCQMTVAERALWWEGARAAYRSVWEQATNSTWGFTGEGLRMRMRALFWVHVGEEPGNCWSPKSEISQNRKEVNMKISQFIINNN